jgi:dTDP-4-dehydrorhamnose 3,5-epimerase
MQSRTLAIPGPVLIQPRMIGDERGFFMEAFKDGWFRENIGDVVFVQDNQSLSREAGTIRGLHYQTEPFAQGKLVRCLKGAIFDVAVDIRPESPHFGRWIGETLTAAKGEQLWVPAGFAHGFCTLEPDTEVFYKVTCPYSAPNDAGIAFDDPDIGIEWPLPAETLVLSEKDRNAPYLHATETFE